MQTNEGSRAYDVVVIGAGYAGLMAALRLAAAGAAHDGDCARERCSDHFIERVRLQESIVAAVAPRIPSIRPSSPGPIRFVRGHVVGSTPPGAASGCARRRRAGACFARAVYALGSAIDLERVKGAAEHAYRLEAGEVRARSQPCGPGFQRMGSPASRGRGGRPRNRDRGRRRNQDRMAGRRGHHGCRSRCGDFKARRVEDAIRGALARLNVRLMDGEAVNEVRPAEILTDRGRAFPTTSASGRADSAPAVARAAGLATDPRGEFGRSEPPLDLSPPYHGGRRRRPPGRPDRRRLPDVRLRGGGVRCPCRRCHSGEEKRQLRPFSFSAFGQGVAIGRSGAGFSAILTTGKACSS